MEVFLESPILLLDIRYHSVDVMQWFDQNNFEIVAGELVVYPHNILLRHRCHLE